MTRLREVAPESAASRPRGGSQQAPATGDRITKTSLKHRIIGAYRWLVLRPGYMLLTANDEALTAQSPSRFVHVWWGALMLSLMYGVALAWLWAAAWAVFRDVTGLLLAPVLAVVLAMMLWLYRPAALALGEALAGRDARSLGVASVVLSFALAGIGLPHMVWDLAYLPAWLTWLRPRPEYRILILAPVWGAWSMLVTCRFCKPFQSTEPAVAAMAEGAGPIAATVSMGAAMALSVWWLGFMSGAALLVPGVTIIVAAVGGPLFCRRAGGLNRSALLASNLFTQFAFWMAYLAFR